MAQKTLEEQIRSKLDEAVKALFKPPVLIGAQWLQAFPNGKPADFQYIGTVKVAKASGKTVSRVTEKILRHAELESLGVTVEITGTGVLNINQKNKPKEAPKDSGSPESVQEAAPETIVTPVDEAHVFEAAQAALEALANAVPAEALAASEPETPIAEPVEPITEAPPAEDSPTPPKKPRKPRKPSAKKES